ncbi:hypothetical protein ILUMI_20393 [Ignelater luminosus]|uniref:Uncharacterized protein n=1 Tax=Ignelater luminosus TaxID=2038154 RepID=A0A8K0CEB5_IGNLU|nr:hypothetical protein ILUMI_20393 [Ignelater luminosus]
MSDFGKTRYLNQQELEAELEAALDEIKAERLENENVDVVYIPPDLDELTDQEDIDEDVITENDVLDREIAGTFEIHGPDKEDDEFTDSDDEPLAAKIARLEQKRDIQPKWRKEEFQYTIIPTTNEKLNTEDIEKRLGDKSPLEIFGLYLDDKILSMIVNYSNKTPELTKSGVHHYTDGALNQLPVKAYLLTDNEINNRSEFFIGLLARFNMGKKLNLVQRDGFQARTYLTGLNLHPPADYGFNIADVEIDEDNLKKVIAELTRRMKVSTNEIEEIAKNTVGNLIISSMRDFACVT